LAAAKGRLNAFADPMRVDTAARRVIRLVRKAVIENQGKTMDELLGSIMMFAGSYAPEHYKDCDGSLMNISKNPALFSFMGTRYGGDGRETFGLPDLRDRDPDGTPIPYGEKPRWIICVDGRFPSRWP
jgi:hypothetical protein